MNQRIRIKNEILSRSSELFEKARYQGYVCPLCGSGSGPHGTGMTTKDGIHFTCWACEEIKNSDVFDIMGKVYDLDTFNEQFAFLQEELEIE